MALAPRSSLRLRAPAPLAGLLAVALVPAPASGQGEPVTFSATGDYPYGGSELADLQQHMDLHNLYSPSDFFVHVGDINAGTETCRESRSIDVRDELIRLAVPAFCLVGDNEWTDCSNPDQAWVWYETYLANLDQYFCYPWQVERQAVRDENWAFVHKGVLFAGINIPNGDGGNKAERLQDDADWVDFQMVDKKSQVRAAVIFGHTGPGGSHDLFFNQFEQSSATFGKPVLYIMGDKHSWQYDNPFSEPNMRRIIVERGGVEQPVQVTVTMATSTPWNIVRDPWQGNPSPFDHAPCVDVGDDRSVAAGSPLPISAFVQDDGNTTVLWSKRSGPGTVTFGNPQNESTTAQFSSAGTYEIRCTANDGTNQTYDELVVDVTGSSGDIFLTIADVTVTEGNSGTTTASFSVVRSGSGSGSCSVSYASADSSATSPSDYGAVSGTLSFSSTGTKTISVSVQGDTQVELDEVFFVNLFNATNGAIITKSQGRGTIQNDDVPPPNDPPTARPDAYAIAEDDTLVVSAPGLLANDDDPEGQPLSAAVVDPPAHGTLALAADGSFTYAPELDFDAQDGFTYRAADGFGGFDTAAVAIDVTPVNDPPVAMNDTWGTEIDATLFVAAPGVLANDIDVDDTTLSATLLSSPVHGSLSFAANGSFTYDPEPGFFGTDTFTYRAHDPSGPGGTATVTIGIGTPEQTVLVPLEDTYVRVSGSTTTFGTDPILRIRGGSSSYVTFVKFDLTGLGPVAVAKLRLYVTDYGTDATCHVVGNDYAGTSTPWQEEGLYWDVAPPLGPAFATVLPPSPGNWLEVDVAPQIAGADVWSVALAGTTANSTRFSSKEGVQAPELVVTTYTGGPVPDIAASPLAHDWGDVTVGDSSSRSFRIRNDGGADLNVSSTALVGPDASEFSVGAGGGSFVVAPGDSHDVEVSFAPAAAGSKSATLRVASDDPDENPLDLGLAGNAVAAPVPDIAASPSSRDWGDVVVGDAATGSFSIRNVGGVLLSVSAPTLTGPNAAEFAITAGAGAFALAPGDSHAIDVSFAPAGLGTRTAALRLASNDPDENPLDVALAGNGVPVPSPDIAVVPATWDFGDLYEGASVSHTFTVRNDGTGDLSVTATSLEGSHAAEFAIVSGGGAFGLAPGATRSVEVRFDPQAPGAKSAALRLASDDPDENPLDVALTGNCLELPAGGEVTFDAVAAGGSNGGTTVTSDPLGPPAAGAPGDLYLVAVSSKPYTPVVAVAGLGLAWTPVREQCGARQQTGMALWAATGPTAGGSVTATFAGSVSTAAVTVTRYTGAHPAAPIGAILSGNTQGVDGPCSGGSDVTSYDLPLATTVPGSVVSSCVSVRRRTHEPGAGWTERIDVTYGSGGNAAGVAVMDRAVPVPGALSVNGTFSGTVDWSLVAVEILPGVVADVPDIAVVPAAHDFGSVVAGSGSVEQTFSVTNEGTADLSVGSVTLAGPDAGAFSIVAGGGAFVLAPGGSRAVDVSFAPATLGAKSAVLRFDSDDPNESPLDVPLSGVGAPPPSPDVAASPASHDFGDVVVGDGATASIDILNVGTASLSVSSVTLVGADAVEYAISFGAGAFALAPGDSHRVDVDFAPVTTGTKSASLRVASDDPDENPFDVPLAGRGVDSPTPDVAVTPLSHDYGDVYVGSSASHGFTIRNDGSADLAVTSVSLAGADAGEFTIDAGGGSATLAPGATRNVTVSFRPGSAGVRSALLRVASDDPDEPLVDAALAGTGLAVPPGGVDIVLEEVVGGGSTSSQVVTTTGDVAAADTHLYVAAITTKKFREAVSVDGLGLAWSPVLTQCSGRGQTGIELWVAQGSPTASGPVTATLADLPENAAIAVARYSGVAGIGNTASANSLGEGGACAGGVDGASYTFALSTGVAEAVVVSAAAMRVKSHEPGIGWTERIEWIQGSGGGGSGVAVMDRRFASPGVVSVEGSFSGTVDWAVGALELRPSPPTSIVHAGESRVAPDVTEAASGTALVTTSPHALSLRVAPNPFRTDVAIELELPGAVAFDLTVYDAAGRVVRRLAGGERGAGHHTARWDGRDAYGLRLASGVYFVRLTAGTEVRLRKVVLAR